MSFKAIKAVVAQSRARGEAKWVLSLLAMHQNPETGLISPSLATLARESGLWRSRVAQLISELENMGELSHVNRAGPRGGTTSNSYEIHLNDEKDPVHNAGHPPSRNSDTPSPSHRTPPVREDGRPPSRIPDGKGNKKENQKEKKEPQLQPVPSARRTASRPGDCGGNSFFFSEGSTTSPEQGAQSAQPPNSAHPPYFEAHQQILEAWPSVVAEARGLNRSEAAPLTPGQKKKIAAHLKKNEVEDATAFLVMLAGAVQIAPSTKVLSNEMNTKARDYQDLTSFYTKFMDRDATRLFDHVGTGDREAYVYDKVAGWWTSIARDSKGYERAEDVVYMILGREAELKARRSREAVEGEKAEAKEQAAALNSAVAETVDDLVRRGVDYCLEDDPKAKHSDMIVLEGADYSESRGGGRLTGEYTMRRYLRFLRRKSLSNDETSAGRFVRMLLEKQKVGFRPTLGEIWWS